MGHYKSNMRDLQFNLFDVFELDKVLESGAVSYTHLTLPTNREV